MLEELVPLVPAHFFEMQAPLYFAKESKLKEVHLLPDTAPFHGLSSFGQVRLGWNDEGIVGELEVKGTFHQPEFPRMERGDLLEFFFDTRDVKTGGYNTRFCHHFFFLPTIIDYNGERIQAGEITRFRTEDAHPLCEGSKLEIEVVSKNHLKIFIPASCLYGYDPKEFNRIGFTYRVIRKNGDRQYFSVSDKNFPIEQQPAFWASLRMMR